jgi:hypothetical protein
VPYQLLEEVPDLAGGDGDPGNMLIEGGNLEALKALLPFFAGQVKCIYIDPPYNTRSAFEHYDDNLEHAQWLAMIVPRLQLLREFLRATFGCQSLAGVRSVRNTLWEVLLRALGFRTPSKGRTPQIPSRSILLAGGSLWGEGSQKSCSTKAWVYPPRGFACLAVLSDIRTSVPDVDDPGRWGALPAPS